ncbi:MAG: SIS domain-containing protein [Clostridiales bacterium]|nr:SIS domain-containing protein [Clostridiales bacterium]
MKKETLAILEKTIIDHPALSICRDDIIKAYNVLITCYENGGTVLICGNGGSAADSEHIVGEFMKGFLKRRPLPAIDKEKIGDETLFENMQGALPAISLVSQTSIVTAFMNDVEPNMVFAQQVYGYRNENNVLIGITTSGNSKNIVNAVKVANAFKMNTIGMTGESGGMLNSLCTVTLKAPAIETYRVQEYHLPIYHALCAMVESEFFEL